MNGALNTFVKNDSEISKVELSNRVVRYKNQIVVYREVPFISTFTVTHMFSEVQKIIYEGQKIFLVLDLTESNKPSAAIRSVISEEVKKIKDQIVHCSIYSGRNKMINLLAKFALGGVGFESYTISSTLQGALDQFTKYGLKEAKLIPYDGK